MTFRATPPSAGQPALTQRPPAVQGTLSPCATTSLRQRYERHDPPVRPAQRQRGDHAQGGRWRVVRGDRQRPPGRGPGPAPEMTGRRRALLATSVLIDYPADQVAEVADELAVSAITMAKLHDGVSASSNPLEQLRRRQRLQLVHELYDVL